MTFEREERIALARILSDLIESDTVIEMNELRSFDKIRNDKTFRISMEMLSEAKTKSFAEAVSILQKVKGEEKKQLIKDKLYEMSLSDGTCVPIEALQIIAVMYAIEGKGRVVSIPEVSDYIENMTVIYVENEDNTAADAYIRGNYRSICNEFRLAGFKFVYIPKIAEDYRQISGEYLGKVISYMIPSVTDSKIEKMQSDLCSMTTSRFTYELLYKKMGINMLNSKPAFLIKIGESAVADKSGVDDMERNIHSNFLLIPLNESKETTSNACNMLTLVVEMMDLYRSMVSGKLEIEARQMPNKFIYSGFHRSLFDLIAYGKDKIDYKLVINLKNRANPVVLRPIQSSLDSCDEDISINLNAQPYSLYILMVCLSIKGSGLDWKGYADTNPVRKNLLDQYNSIYRLLGKGNTNAEYRDKTHVSRIKKALLRYEKIVSNIDLFIPEKMTDGENTFYKIHISPDLVYVIEGDVGKEKEVGIIDSELLKEM